MWRFRSNRDDVAFPEWLVSEYDHAAAKFASPRWTRATSPCTDDCRPARGGAPLHCLRVVRTGKLLDRCLAEAGIDRAWTYITNVVKHFKWVPRGSRRVHNKPGEVVIEPLFSVAQGRNCGDSAANHRCAGSDGGTGLVWKSVPRHLGSRSTDAVGVGDRYARDSAPLGTFVRSRRGMGRTRNPQIRRDFRKVAAMVT